MQGTEVIDGRAQLFSVSFSILRGLAAVPSEPHQALQMHTISSTRNPGRK